MITQEGRISSPPAREAEQRLEELLEEFDLWAASADRSDAGWESDFPQWRELMRQAEQIMAVKTQNEHSLFLLGRCWAISEENETCAYWAREHLEDAYAKHLVQQLTGSTERDTRWQAYDVLSDLPVLDSKTRNILETGIADTDAYVRRRAFSALLRHSEIDTQPYVIQMLTDSDIYNRYVGVKEAIHLGSETLHNQVQAALQDPAVTELYDYYLNHKELIDN
ncbi:MAG: HEAT repeat domain-containing protein [Janthinobacterium lividum]